MPNQSNKLKQQETLLNHYCVLIEPEMFQSTN